MYIYHAYCSEQSTSHATVDAVSQLETALLKGITWTHPGVFLPIIEILFVIYLILLQSKDD